MGVVDCVALPHALTVPLPHALAVGDAESEGDALPHVLAVGEADSEGNALPHAVPLCDSVALALPETLAVGV